VAEYQRHLLNRRIPSLRVLRVCQTFWDTGYFPQFALQLSVRLI
jgi:hypothetical protein